MTTAAQEVGQLRKTGQLDAALVRAREAFAINPRDSYLQVAYGWVLYALVKREAEAFEKGRIPPGRVTALFNEWLTEYKQLDLLQRPDSLHSLLLTQLLKVLKGAKAWSGFLQFVRWADPQALRPEDREPFQMNNGKQGPSLEMRLLYAISRCAVAGDADPRLLVWADNMLDDGLAANPYDQWLQFYKSKRLIIQGRVAEAQEFLIRLIKRQSRAGWLWDHLGQTWEIDDRNQAMICYYRAIQLAGKPEDVLKTRVRLAECLVVANRYPEAARQVRTALEVRQYHQWPTPHNLAQLARADWYQQLWGESHLPAEPDVTKEAEALIFGEETALKIGVIDSQNIEKSLAHIAFSAEDGIVLHYRKFRDIAKLPVGALVEIRFRGEPPIPYSITSPAMTIIEGFYQTFAGILSRRPGQAFAFVEAENDERVFVPPYLLTDPKLVPNSPVNCQAVYVTDRKSGKLGWRALRLTMEVK